LLMAGLAGVAAGALTLVEPAIPTPPDTGMVTARAPAPQQGQNGAQPPVQGAPPRRLELPGVSAEVVPAGVSADGQLRLPDDPAQVGWWIGGAAPGEVGTVIIAGHVDSHTGEMGALFTLSELQIGDTVSLATAGQRYSYRVTGRRTVDKQDLPADTFAQNVSQRLVLITCGGRFHDGQYESNVLVYADPL
jgi:LPXTG-site transpeptidase (sortase) family protein